MSCLLCKYNDVYDSKDPIFKHIDDIIKEYFKVKEENEKHVQNISQLKDLNKSNFTLIVDLKKACKLNQQHVLNLQKKISRENEAAVANLESKNQIILNLQTKYANDCGSAHSTIRELEAKVVTLQERIFLASSPLTKRRKAQSFETPPNKPIPASTKCTSDPDISFSKGPKEDQFNENICPQVDTDESFFAMTQSPKKRVVPLSPRNSDENILKNICKEEQGDDSSEKRKKKRNLLKLRPSTLNKILMSPETVELELPVREKTVIKQEPDQNTTTKPPEQELNKSRWNSKKVIASPSSKSAFAKPISSFFKSSEKVKTAQNNSKLKQTKISFCAETSSSNKNLDDEDETYCDELIAPSPTSFSSRSDSKYLKHVQKKNKSKIKSGEDLFNFNTKIPSADDDEDDIDATFCNEPTIKVKREPTTQPRPKRNFKQSETAVREEPNSQDSDSSSVCILAPNNDTDDFIFLEETSNDQNDKLLEEILEHKEDEAVVNIQKLNQNKVNKKNQEYAFKKSPIRKKSDKVAQIIGYHCPDCINYYEYLAACGKNEQEIRAKLNKCSKHRNNVVLHDTPEGFWDPTFSPTQ